jgi:Yip1 domain
MLGAARLRGRMFRSLREDSDATGQSLVVLAIAGLSFGLGFALSLGGDLGATLLGGVFGIAASIVLGFVWTSLTFIVGTRLFRGNTSYWGLARPLFFSASPGVVFLLTLVPSASVQETFRVLGIAWIAIASVSAVKNAFGFDSQRGFMTFIIVALILFVAYGLVISI